ncbi:hypothetical protein ACFLV5_00395 [Chloroflexota bacterium]
MSVLDQFPIWWLRSGRYWWSRLRRRLFERRYLSTALPPVNSLEEIEACLKKVKWTMDGPLHLFDCISYPQTVWARKKDDCDGFAILAAKLLLRWAPDTNPVLVTAIVSPLQLSHTICAFRYGDSFMFFDNNYLRKGSFQKYSDMVNQFIRSAERLICWDVIKPDTLETLEFHVRR